MPEEEKEDLEIKKKAIVQDIVDYWGIKLKEINKSLIKHWFFFNYFLFSDMFEEIYKRAVFLINEKD